MCWVQSAGDERGERLIFYLKVEFQTVFAVYFSGAFSSDFSGILNETEI